MKEWKTTIAAVAAIVLYLCGSTGLETADINSWGEKAAGFITALGLVFAKDAPKKEPKDVKQK